MGKKTFIGISIKLCYLNIYLLKITILRKTSYSKIQLKVKR